MNWKERMRYQASWGEWYVQIEFEDGQIMELKFAKSPDSKQLAIAVSKLQEIIANTPVVKPVELVELSVDNAIAYLEGQMASTDAKAKSKITAFVTAVKPVEPIVKVVR